jgi:hypothetical protein
VIDWTGCDRRYSVRFIVPARPAGSENANRFLADGANDFVKRRRPVGRRL